MILQEFKKVLHKTGIIILVISHPCFDPYVQFGFKYKKNVRTKFKSYYEQGALYHYKPHGAKRAFTDYHSVLQTYFESASKSELKVSRLDECKVSNNLAKSDPDRFHKKSRFPSFLLLELKHDN